MEQSMNNRFVAKLGALALAAVIAVAPLAVAKPGQGGKSGQGSKPAGGGKRQAPNGSSAAMRHLTKELNLTAAQQKRIAPIMNSIGKEALAIQNDKKLTREQKMERFKKLQASSVNRVSAQLNAQQRKKFAAMVKQRGPRRSAPRR